MRDYRAEIKSMRDREWRTRLALGAGPWLLRSLASAVLLAAMLAVALAFAHGAMRLARDVAAIGEHNP